MAQTHARYFNKILDQFGIEHTAERKVDKEKLIKENFAWLLNKTAGMFEYENLPPTMPVLAFERLLQMTGAVVVWNVPAYYKPIGFGPSFNYEELERLNVQPSNDSNLYAFPMNLADAPDPYDEPYKAVITSPGFIPSISETLELNKDCVIVRCDSYYQGLRKFHMKYAKLLAEAEISLQSTMILLRDQMTFLCKTEAQRAAVSAYINAREAGEYVAILAPDLGSPLELLSHEGRSNAVELAVNGLQAIKSAWYNEIGLNPSFSLKREYTSAQEIDVNSFLLLPTIDDMLKCREQGIANINALYGTNISVKKGSAWGLKQEEMETMMKEMKMRSEGLNVQPNGKGDDENGDNPVSSDDGKGSPDSE